MPSSSRPAALLLLLLPFAFPGSTAAQQLFEDPPPPPVPSLQLGRPAGGEEPGALPAAALPAEELPAEELPAGEKNAGERNLGNLTLGTHRARVRQWLGRATLESNIPSLRRLKERYSDGTEVIYVEERAVSVTPGGLAEKTAEGAYLLEGENATVVVEACVLRECGLFLPDAWDKCAIESYYWTAPPNYHPTLYNGIPFTQPFEHVPPSRRDMHDYLRARQPWKDHYRPFGPQRPSPFEIERQRGGPHGGHGPHVPHHGHVEGDCPHCRAQ